MVIYIGYFLVWIQVYSESSRLKALNATNFRIIEKIISPEIQMGDLLLRWRCDHPQNARFRKPTHLPLRILQTPTQNNANHVLRIHRSRRPRRRNLHSTPIIMDSLVSLACRCAINLHNLCKWRRV